jgi:acyl-CoA synthetase (AMP-forming)/AMP-acid ligase II
VAVAPEQDLSLNLIRRVCVGDVATRGAERHGDRPAVAAGDETLSYRELDARANAAGRALLELGLERGELVAILARNSLDFVVTYLGCAKSGLTALPLNLSLRPDELAYVLENSGARALVVEPALGALAAALPAPEHTVEGVPTHDDATPLETLVENDDPVQCLYTSGTTSLPKGVLTSHLAVTMAALNAALGLKLDEHDRAVLCLPLFHTAALNTILLPTLLTGGFVRLLPGWDAPSFLDALTTHRATHALLLPAMWHELLAEPGTKERDWASMRACIYGMAPMPAERVRELQETFGAQVLLGSGQTEFTPPTTLQRPEHQGEKSGSWGPSTTLTDTRIMDPDGRLLPRGEVGEIVYRGPSCMTAYHGNPDATVDAFRHGWFHSGDVGYVDEEGVVWFTDRLKDMIKSGGENVASIEVERALLAHPGVREAAVVGLPHERWGEAVTAFVRGTATEDDLAKHCEERLALFKVPKRIVVVDDLPRTGTGKIQKAPLRAANAALYADSG